MDIRHFDNGHIIEVEDDFVLPFGQNLFHFENKK